MDAADYLTMLRRYWRSILICTVAGAVFGIVGALGSTPEHESSAKLLFVGNDGPTVQLAVQSYADLATTEAVLAPVAAELDVDDWTDLEDVVSTEASLTSQVITVTGSDEDEQAAADIANAVAASIVQQAELATDEVGDGVLKGRVVETAVVDDDDEESPVVKYAVGGALGGFLIGFAQALVRYWRVRLRDKVGFAGGTT